MDKLRDALPVVANSARDLTSQIGNAGRTAQTQLEGLIGGFHRLNTFGEASERQIEALRGRIDAALARLRKRRPPRWTKAARAPSPRSANGSRRCAAKARRSRNRCGQGENEALETCGQGDRCDARAAGRGAQGSASDTDAASVERTHSRMMALAEEAKQVNAALDQRAVSFMDDVEARRQQHAATKPRISPRSTRNSPNSILRLPHGIRRRSATSKAWRTAADRFRRRWRESARPWRRSPRAASQIGGDLVASDRAALGAARTPTSRCSMPPAAQWRASPMPACGCWN